MARNLRVLVLVLAALLTAAAAFAADPAASAQETAVFEVAQLSKEAVVKDLAKALANEPGVVKAKAEVDKGLFAVTFEPGKTNPETLTKAMTAVAGEVKLKEVIGAKSGAAVPSACGACPSRSACGSKKK
jgi:copper chaperone CopZ